MRKFLSGCLAAVAWTALFLALAFCFWATFYMWQKGTVAIDRPVTIFGWGMRLEYLIACLCAIGAAVVLLLGFSRGKSTREKSSLETFLFTIKDEVNAVCIQARAAKEQFEGRLRSPSIDREVLRQLFFSFDRLVDSLWLKKASGDFRAIKKIRQILADEMRRLEKLLKGFDSEEDSRQASEKLPYDDVAAGLRQILTRLDEIQSSAEKSLIEASSNRASDGLAADLQPALARARLSVGRLGVGAFTMLFCISVALAILFPHPTPEQQFNFRVLAALAAAGVASAIPGFFEIKTDWARVAISAGGPLGIFTLLYLVNPATLQSPMSKQKVVDVSGDWEYRSVPLTDRIPGAVRLGGTVNIVQDDMGIRMDGTQDWVVGYGADGVTITNASESEEIWQGAEGGFVSPTRIRYGNTLQDGTGFEECSAVVDITARDGKCLSMRGKSVTFGRKVVRNQIEFRRMVSAKDRLWISVSEDKKTK